MHLTDDELLSNGPQIQAHLNECEDCMRRYKHRQALNNLCQTLPEQTAPEFIWQRIEADFTQHDLEQKNAKMSKQIKQWRIVSLSLAASIAFLYFGNIIMFNSPTDRVRDSAQVINNTNDNTVRLSQIIAQNAKLEKELRLVEAGYNNLEIVQLASRLSLIDNQLQKAYFEESNDDTKHALWELRLSILKGISQIHIANQQSSQRQI